MTIQVTEWRFLIISMGVAFSCLAIRAPIVGGSASGTDPETSKRQPKVAFSVPQDARQNNLLKCQLFNFISVQQDLLRQESGLEQLLEYAEYICPDGTKKCLLGYQLYTVVRLTNTHAHRYMFHMEKNEDPNMSGLQPNPRSSHSSDPTQANDPIYDWTRREFWFTVIVAFLFGFTVRPHLSTIKCCICNCYFMVLGKRSKHYEERPKIAVDSNLNLDILPFDLKDFLIKKLDVPHQGGHFFGSEKAFGWEKVGEAFNISRGELEFIKLEYKSGGSPTGTLLEMLGKAEEKTISDLVDVLKSPAVNRLDITSVIKLT